MAIIRCHRLKEALIDYQRAGSTLISLCADAQQSLGNYTEQGVNIYILGNETKGISDDIKQLVNESLSIPMNNNVESLNVAITAALIAFRPVI